jgi:hypothetical protein
VQDVSHLELLAADKRMRVVLGLPLDDDAQRVHFGELHDALTSMRAHQKRIHPDLTPSDLDLINRLVCACDSMHVVHVVQPAHTQVPCSSCGLC